MDVVLSPEGVRILSWRSSGAAAEGNPTPASTEGAARSFAELASLGAGRTLVYELRHKLGHSGWEQEGLRLLGEVKPADAQPEEAEQPVRRGGTDPDDVEQIVADVQNARRLVLSTAAELIAEQDPTRLDNILFSIGPLAVVGRLKVGRVLRVGRKWRPRQITDAACELGCENVARQINKHVGGRSSVSPPRALPRSAASVTRTGDGYTTKW